MPRRAKYSIAGVGTATLAVASAVGFLLDHSEWASALLALLVGLVGLMLLSTAKGLIDLARENQAVVDGARRQVREDVRVAKRRMVSVVQNDTQRLERDLQSVRFGQSVLTQGVNQTQLRLLDLSKRVDQTLESTDRSLGAVADLSESIAAGLLETDGAARD